MANTMTIAQKYDALVTAIAEMGIVFEDGQSAIDFLTDRRAKSVKKSSGGAKKASPEQTWLRNAIVELLSENPNPMSVGEISAALSTRADKPSEAKLSTSSITANIGTMLTNGKSPNPDGILTRVMDKRVAKFTMAENVTESEGEAE